MSIKRSFGGTLLRKPGAYSTTKVDQSGGTPLGDNGILLIVGEAEKGVPGDQEGFQKYTSAQFARLVEDFGSGPIVDVAKAALTPSRTPGIGGADEFVIWKTNSSTRASLDLSNGSDDLMKMEDTNWGAAGNRISIEIVDGTTSLQKKMTLRQNDITEIMPENDAAPQLEIQYVGAGTDAGLSISGTLGAESLSTVITAGPGGEDLSIALANHTMKSLAESINSSTAYTATLKNTQAGSVVSALDLDPVAGINIIATAQILYRLQEELVEVVAGNSSIASLSITDSKTGILANISQTFLAGGAKGASASSDFSDGLNASLNESWNVCVPAVSQDATADILDGLTDSASTYDVDAIQAALDAHLRLRGSVKNRKEAQGMVGRRDASIEDSYAAARTLGSELIQMCVQDVLVVDSAGSLQWKQPHTMAGLMAGIRLGSEVGEPLTHKFVSTNGVGHAVNAATGISQGDFNPNTDFDVAIDAGITFTEDVNAANRVVVDNTTYGADQSFVWNRGSVIEAAQFVARTLRETAELVFVGKKVSAGIAQSIKTVLRSKMIDLFDAQILTESVDAPLGFKEATFVVAIEGNTAKVSVEVIPVQGLDFVLIEFTLGDIRQSA